VALNTAELTTGSSRNSLARVHIREEHGRVLFNLADVEAVPGIHTLHDNASLERTAKAADAVAATFTNLDGVGERNARLKCQ
jgi:ribosomal protein S9